MRHERGPVLTIYIPAPESHYIRTLIQHGSGIVGSPASEPGHVVIDYEGNIYGAEALAQYEDKLKQAAGRHAKHYPTVARLTVKENQLIAIGSYDTRVWQATISPTEDNQWLFTEWTRSE